MQLEDLHIKASASRILLEKGKQSAEGAERKPTLQMEEWKVSHTYFKSALKTLIIPKYQSIVYSKQQTRCP